MVRTDAGTILEQSQITNPRYSKPLDVHRYCEHPEARKLIRSIWEDCFGAPSEANTRKGGVKPKASSLTQLGTTITDLYAAWSTDPELSLGVAMNNAAWDTGSRYNKIGLSRQTPTIIRCLQENGYIDLSPGSYAGPGAATNRITRIRAAERLRALFREVKFGPQHLLTHPGKECIIMRGSERSERNLEYEDTSEARRMREDLTAYNQLLQRTFIDVPDQELPFIERPIKSGAKRGEVTRQSVCGMDNFVHRVFNREDWRCGGRFYGGWWQNCGSEYRKRIHINDEPTVEVDYRALHVAILAAKQGIKLEGDPYELEAGVVEGLEADEQRRLVKLLTLVALNAPSRKAACSAFRDQAPTGSREKSMTNAELGRVLYAVVERHPFLRDGLCSDQGIHLMNTDSRIAALVLRSFTRRGIPVLCIHDSFIIGYSKAILLKRAMKLAALRVIGSEVEVSNNYL
uniref:hypothetical protein n=1 Tax=Albibacillus kandeliae TaxID=2174228 RepID=UPI000D696ED6